MPINRKTGKLWYKHTLGYYTTVKIIVTFPILSVARVKFCKIYNISLRIIPRYHVSESQNVHFEKL